MIRSPRHSGGSGFWTYWSCLTGAVLLTKLERPRRCHSFSLPLRLVHLLFIVLPLHFVLYGAMVLLAFHLGRVWPAGGMLAAFCFTAACALQTLDYCKRALLGS